MSMRSYIRLLLSIELQLLIVIESLPSGKEGNGKLREVMWLSKRGQINKKF